MNYWIFKDKYNRAEIAINGDSVKLSNGLITRIVDVKRGTLSLLNQGTQREYLTSQGSDLELVIDNRNIDFYAEFAFKKAEISGIIADIAFNPTHCNTGNGDYPPSGQRIKLDYESSFAMASVIYEIYDNLPVISKRVFITNKLQKPIVINAFVLDRLAIAAEDYAYFYGETSYNGGCMLNNSRTLSVQYKDDVLRLAFDVGPDASVKPNEEFASFIGYELLHTAKFYEQRMIEVKEMYRQLFPWVLESPLIFHITSDNKYAVARAINKVSEVNFDMIMQSFGSGIDVESTNKKYIAKHKKLYAYAHSKGIKIGGYTLAIVKNYRPVRGAELNERGDPKGRIMRCLATEWSQNYWQNILNFYKETAADCIEIDGPYHFVQCDGGATHLHKGLTDSRYLQWKLSTVEVFKKLKQMGIYVNAPDWLFLNGLNKSGIGYEEIAFSEPRQAQLLSARIYNYKGTFNKIPSMAWAFLPLGQYHGGGKKAMFQPLKKNILDYEWAIAQHFISGVIPCFRGKELYDCPKVCAMVKKWVKFYKKYRTVINGTTIHFLPPIIDKSNPLRASGIDAILNVVCCGEVRGVLGVFNQTDSAVNKKIAVPMYYTGLTNLAQIPPPHAGCGITDVANPVYGEYPPAFPTAEGKSMAISDMFSVNKSAATLAEEKIVAQKSAGTSGKATFWQEETAATVLDIDGNGDCELAVSLAPNSFTWYIIKQ